MSDDKKYEVILNYCATEIRLPATDKASADKLASLMSKIFREYFVEVAHDGIRRAY